MSPWHSKMATEQDLVKKGSECVHWILAVKWKAFLPLTFKDGKITLTFSTPLWHLSAPLKSPPAPARKLCFLDLQLLNLQLQDLHIVVLQLLDEPPATGPPAPGSPPLGPGAHGPPALQQHQWGPAQPERDWLRANLNLPRNCIAVAVCANYFRTTFKEQHCEYSFN